MRRFAQALWLGAVAAAVVSLRFRGAVRAGADLPQAGGVLRSALVVAAVTAALLAALGALCRRPGGRIGVILAGGALAAAAAATGASWLAALAIAALLPWVFGPPVRLRGRASLRVLTAAAAVALALGAGYALRFGWFPPAQQRGPETGVAVLPSGGLAITNRPYVSVLVRRTGPGPAQVRLVRASGGLVAPFGGGPGDDGGWHRINFLAPREAFTVRTIGPLRQGPVLAYGAGVRLAEKAVSGGTPLLIAAAIAAVAGLCLLARQEIRAGHPAPLRRWFGWAPEEARLLPLLALAAYLGAVAPFLDVYAGGADSSGYLNSAQLLRSGHLTAALRRPADAGGLKDSLFIPPGFVLRPGSGARAPRMIPTYPVGLPVLFGLAGTVLPEAAAVPAVILAELAAGILLLWLLSRRIFGDEAWAAAAAAALALCPLYLFMGLQPMSDVPALVWVLAAIVAGLGREPRSALLCGAATGMAVLIRPSNVLAVPAILVALGLRPKRWGLWLLGGLPFALGEVFYNARLYGDALVTGYGNPSGLFSAAWVAPTLLHYLLWFPQLLTPLVFLALALPLAAPSAPPPRLRGLLALWALPLFFFYAAYSCTHETWWYLRFLLPTFPAWIVASALVARRVAGGTRAARLAAPAFALVAGLMLWIEGGRLGVLDSGRGNAVYAECSRWIAAHAPENTVVVCNIAGGAVFHYTALPFVCPTTAAEAAQVAAYATRAHRPLYALYFRFAQEPLDWFSRGRWDLVHASGDMRVWRYRPGGG